MPIQNGTKVCINHQHTALNAQEGFHALTVFIKNGQQYSFNPASGIPVKVYVCPQCGYVEIYAAQSTPEWNQ